MTDDRQLIYTGGESLIYVETSPNGKVVRKVLHTLAPDQDQVQRFHNEFEFTKNLDIPGIRKSFGRSKDEGQHSIRLQYIDGITLEEAFVGKGLPLAQILEVFTDIAQTLGQLHDEGIIHKDINGRNILWSEADSKATIIDFGISSKLDYVSNNLGNPDKLKGTLTHIPPEQTGRVNRKVDSRSDLYSLGITLYHILSGSLPFVSKDSLELVHAHIARRVEPVHHINPDVPEILSRIVEKLIAKNAEDRYQTAFGLANDLKKCTEFLQTSGSIPLFKLGEQDFSGKFLIPQKLYGREVEVEALLTSFDRISKGKTELFLVGGYSGVGKSALIAEIYKPITERRGHFVSGKFDQYQRNIPYSAITQALEEFCELLLTEREESLNLWREKIQQSVGQNGAVLTELMPTLAYIIGDQPDAPKLDPQEAQNRFNLVFQSFIRCIAQPEHPFVLFCDDLQWADTASLNLIKMLVSDESNRYLLVIGAFRNNEIIPGHQLTVMLDDARREEATIVDIELAPLTEIDLFNLIKDTLHLDDGHTHELTSVVYSKTLGNAFFSLELLKSLNQYDCIRFDTDNQIWKVNVEAIQNRGISSNVVELLISKIILFQEETQQILKIASCIGALFDLTTLSKILDTSVRIILERLWPAVLEGLIVPVDEAYQYVGLEDIELERKCEFVFSHDRVQQASYTLMGDAEKDFTHLRIGRLLQEDPDNHSLFDIVNHLNNAISLIESDEDKRKLAKMNLQAALQARDSGAYTSAQAFIKISVSLTPNEVWETDYAFALQQAQTEAEIEFLNGNVDGSEKLFHECLGKAKTPIEKSVIYYMLMQNQNGSSRYADSLVSARSGLPLLDFILPDNDKCGGFIPEEMGKALAYFQEHGVESIYNKPDMTDERALAIIHLLDNVSPPAYLSGETNLWILHVLYKINLTIEYGLSPEGGYAFTELGLIFFLQGNYELGYPSARLSMKITEKFRHRSPRHVSRAGHIVVNYNYPWVKHFSEIIRMIPEVYQNALDSGELIFVGYASLYLQYTALHLGKDSLEAIRTRLPESLAFCKKIHNVLATDAIMGLMLLVENMMGLTKDGRTFATKDLDEDSFLANCKSSNDLYSIGNYHVCRAYALYLHSEYDEAMKSIETANSLAAVIHGAAVFHTVLNMTHSLVLLAIARREAELSAPARAQIEQNQVQLKLWADHNKANFEHKYLLVEAELAWTTGDHARASKYYNDAIASAEENDFMREVGLIHKLAADFWLEQNVPIYAESHLERSIKILDALGYKRLTSSMKHDYAAHIMTGQRSSSDIDTLTFTRTSTTAMSVGSLDISSIFKSARALSESIEMDTLLNKMLHIVIENAGAERAVLMVQESGTWFVRAEYDINSRQTDIRKIPLDQYAMVPVSIVNYVMRTNNNALSTSDVMQKIIERDEYVIEQRPASFFCMPLTHKGATNAILYVEHRSGSDILTRDRMDVLETLASQMAVSLENATLYQRQADLITAAQRFVPQDFVRALGHNNILEVKLGDGISREMTVMFCDIRSYSSIAERLTVEENFKFINSYLQRVGPVIRKNNGFINHYSGDGFIALFTQNPSDALLTAQEIVVELESFNQDRLERNLVPIRLGFGIHTGQVMMGIIGDGERQDANVIADAVNTASRLEGLTKAYGSTVILSEQTMDKVVNVEQFQIRYLGKVRMVGKEEVVTVFELYGADEPDLRTGKQRWLPTYQQALEDYYSKRFAESAVAFKKILDEFPKDRSSRRFLDFAARHMIEGVPVDWEGIETLQVK
ncbi:MAG: AAA family ATPase [Ignavibacteria bacterium]|nr:AAA family ATPase [Ignavibacteria bacterium]